MLENNIKGQAWFQRTAFFLLWLHHLETQLQLQFCGGGQKPAWSPGSIWLQPKKHKEGPT